MESFSIQVASTSKRQVVDLTDAVNRKLGETESEDGVCFLFALHTTAALAVQEVGEGTEDDLLEVLDKLIPRIRFRHGHDPAHAPDHMISTIVGPDLALPVAGGRLALGTWQRVLFLELNGPRDRAVLGRVLG